MTESAPPPVNASTAGPVPSAEHHLPDTRDRIPSLRGELDEWLDRARSGDLAAERQFLEAVRPLLLRWALVRTGSPDDAEDLAQETLLRARRTWDGFQGRARVTSWLYRVLVSVHVDGTRRREVRVRAESTSRPAASPPADARARMNELSERIRAFLSVLSERQREVVNLVDLEGYAPAEVAEMTGLERSTVRVHLHRGRAALRAHLTHIGAYE